MDYHFDKSKVKLGMRTVKTGLAVFLVMVLSLVWGWEGSQIAALTAVFSLRETFDKSLSFGASRILGNTVGGAMAILYVLLALSLGEPIWLDLLLIPLLTMLTIVLNVSLNNADGAVAGASALLIIALGIPSGHSLTYVLTRIFQTFVGVFIAILVNFDWFKAKK